MMEYEAETGRLGLLALEHLWCIHRTGVLERLDEADSVEGCSGGTSRNIDKRTFVGKVSTVMKATSALQTTGPQTTGIEEFEAFLDGGGVVEPGDPMPEDFRREVFRFIELHANSEYMGGLTERDWIPKAPGLHRKLTALAKTQDEIGHAHLLYMVAADMGIKTRDEMMIDLLAGRTKFHNVFHYRAHTWTDQVAIAYLVDAAALASQQAVFKNCSYGPYKRVLRRIIAEEGFHMRNGEELLLVMAEGTEQQRQMMQESIDRWWWPAVQLFGPDSRPDDVLLRWHIKSERNEVLRDRYIQKFVPQLLDYGFTIPDLDLHQNEDGRWVAGTIDWEPLIATMRNGGPDSARRLADARRAWDDAAWVREALDAAASLA
ncbi:MAG: ring-1,2-phenylacetyl-CoA epoxidase subunit PaaA [Candidatus Poriferisodalaceae bacterium]|jgi:ring-1,2-phenylacetyl-CoA epoxidase subunit PaaA